MMPCTHIGGHWALSWIATVKPHCGRCSYMQRVSRSGQALRTPRYGRTTRRCHHELIPVTIDASGYLWIEHVSRRRSNSDMRHTFAVEAVYTLVIESFVDIEAVVDSRPCLLWTSLSMSDMPDCSVQHILVPRKMMASLYSRIEQPALNYEALATVHCDSDIAFAMGS